MTKTNYGYGDKIYTADDLARSKRYKDNTAMLRYLLAKTGNYEVVSGLTHTAGDPVHLQINASRMIAHCDICGEAMAVNPDGAFFCMGCLNYRNENLARPLLVPDDLADICAVLVKRPSARTRNWVPGESLQDLIAENEAEGVQP